MTPNRWRMPPAAVAIHLSVGSIYAWSVFNKPIEAAVPAFPRGAAAYTFSIAIALLGLSAAFGGRWLERVGPRLAARVAAVCFASGLALGGVAVSTQTLWLLYVGVGGIGGIGLGLAYVAPVSALVKWFPDRRGMATGLAVLGFGGGSLIAAPVANALMAQLGVAPTLWVLAAVYGSVMLVAAQFLAPPPDGWIPEAWTPTPDRAAALAAPSMDVAAAIRTPQFWLLWWMLFVNIAAGIAVLSQGSPLMQDVFGRTPAQAAAFLGVIAIANAVGRLGWASLSDVLGRRTVFLTFFAVQSVLFALLPSLGARAEWRLFQVAALVIFTMYGGGFATIPAYLADLFGARNVGAIHGAILTAWSAAGVAGPLVITRIRESRLAALPPGASRVSLYAPTFTAMAVLLATGFLAALASRARADDIREVRHTPILRRLS
ncbi:MAG: OFA family MFS transporter [Gemmatimonadaceae bacterium]|nr:OFA family MFS transporter [Gemmatimonadaceae bacterium]